MNSSPEIQLSDELRQIVAAPPFTLDVEDIERRGVRRRRRGYAARGLAGLAGLGVAVAGGLIVSTHVGAHVGTAATTTGHPARQAPAETAAYVRERIAAALSPSSFIIKARQNTSSIPPAMITIWTDPRTGNTMLLEGSGPGRTAYWEHGYFDRHRVLHWDQTQVNYGPRTWWTYDEHAAGPIDGPVPPGPPGGNYDSPQEIKQLIERGATIVGHPYLDGHRTVELSAPLGGGKFQIWADARTYQVVRTARYFPSGLDAPPIVADYSWIPRSPAMVRLINQPRIPAGFTQVPADGPAESRTAPGAGSRAPR